jgi:hypothetical protein
MRIAPTFIIVLALAGCGKKAGNETPAAGSGSAMAGSGSAATMAGSGSDMGSGSAAMAAGSGAGSGSAMAAGSGAGSAEAAAMAHHAGNCPSTVFGSTTAAEWKTGWKYVIVHVNATGKDAKDAVAAIQKRTDELLKEKQGAKAPTASHDQKGTHGGGMGLCPIYVPEGAKATAKHVKDGVTVTITPKDKAEDLKADVEARIGRAQQWVKDNIKPGDKGNMGGVGGGKGPEKDSNHKGQGDAKGKERGKGGGGGTGGGGGKGTGGGSGSGTGSGKKK